MYGQYSDPTYFVILEGTKPSEHSTFSYKKIYTSQYNSDKILLKGHFVVVDPLREILPNVRGEHLGFPDSISVGGTNRIYRMQVYRGI